MDRPLTRLLVIYPGALGDTLVALPVLAALKQSYAPAVLELIGHPALLEVLPGRSAVDRMRSIEGPEFHALLGDLEAIPPVQQALFERFDVAIAWVPDSEGQLKRTLMKLRIPCVIVRSPGLREPGLRHAMERFRDTLSEAHSSGIGSGRRSCCGGSSREREPVQVLACRSVCRPHPGTFAPGRGDRRARGACG